MALLIVQNLKFGVKFSRMLDVFIQDYMCEVISEFVAFWSSTRGIIHEPTLIFAKFYYKREILIIYL